MRDKKRVWWESVARVCRQVLSSSFSLSFSSTHPAALLAHLFGVWLVMQQPPLPLSSSLSPSFFLCLYILFTCFHSYMQQQRLGCFLTDGRWTHTRTGCKDLPNQGLLDLLMYMQSECMFSRCGSLRPRVSGRRILLVPQASSFQLKSASASVRRCTPADHTRSHLFTALLASWMS